MSADATTAGPPDPFDVVVLGGGMAGLSAALTLVRSRRSTLVVDEGRPRNAPAAAVHGYLTRDGIAPGALLAAGRAEVEGYGGRFAAGRAVAVDGTAGAFTVTLDDGRAFHARRLLMATGLVDELPDVDGLAERWGRDVLHCPYCHGWEACDQAIGVLNTGPASVHQALLFAQLSDDVTFLAHTGPALTEEQAEQLHARGIPVLAGAVAALVVADDRLTGVRTDDGRVVAVQALTVAPHLAARAGLLDGLGLTTVGHPFGIGDQLEVDPAAGGRTAVPGVWAAGNVSDVIAGVVGAADAGVRAAATINMDLITDATQDAVAERRAQAERAIGAGMFTREFWDERYAAREGWTATPNRHLVATASDLEAGRALDVGCGDGADAIWLAEHGWQVSAVDVSPVALARGARQALAVGADVAARIDWAPADLLEWAPAEGAFDLVSAQFIHLEPAAHEAVVAGLAAGVAPGGTLLIVGHHPSDMQTTIPRGRRPELMHTATEVAALLDESEWEVVTDAAPERTTRDGHGDTVTIRDALLRARRRA